MREEWFGKFVEAFFLFQRYPLLGSHPEGKDCLTLLIEEVRKIAAMPDDRVVVIPIDLEAPYVGSAFGARVWEIFFSELEKQKLKHVFTPLSSHLDHFEKLMLDLIRIRKAVVFQ